MFTARHPGRCGNCDERIEPGDKVGWVDGEVCCKQCVEEEGEDE